MRRLALMAGFALASVGCDSGDSPLVDGSVETVDAHIDASGTPAATMPTMVRFGDVACGAYRTMYVQWQNEGDGPLNFAASSPDPRFSFDPPSGQTPPNFGGIIVALARAPDGTSVAGVEVSAPMILTTNLPDSPHLITMTMTPHGGHVTLDPPAVDFGDVVIPGSAERHVMVRNDGTAPVTVRVPTFYAESFQRFFGSFDYQSIAPGESADLTFIFGSSTAEALGFHEYSAVITVSAPYLCGVTPTSIRLTATGVSQ